MRRLLVVSFIALAALVLTPGALSSPPTITRTPIDLTLVDDVDCAFPVQIHIVGTQLTILSTVQGDLREFDAFPNSRATLTNLDTGTTITASIAGPGHITLGADGSFTFVGTGPTLFFFGENPGACAFRVLVTEASAFLAEVQQKIPANRHMRASCAPERGSRLSLR